MAYRLKHKPTGFYYIPSRRVKDRIEHGYIKSNLSKTGKTYYSESNARIALGCIGNSIADHISPDAKKGRWGGTRYSETSVDDWELEKC